MYLVLSLIILTIFSLTFAYILIFAPQSLFWQKLGMILLERILTIILTLKFKNQKYVINYLLAKDQILLLISSRVAQMFITANLTRFFYSHYMFLMIIQLVSQQILYSWLIYLIFIMIQLSFMISNEILIGFLPTSLCFMIYLTLNNIYHLRLSKQFSTKINQKAKKNILNQISHEYKCQNNIIKSHANLIIHKCEQKNSKIEEFK